jgi:DNA-binding XRE family transcriptional regulator
VLERSIPCRLRGDAGTNSKGLDYLAGVKLRLADAIDQALCGLDGISVDRAALDIARVGRVPGTVNQHTHARASLIYTNEAYYNLPDLDAFARKTASKNSNAAAAPIRKTARKGASFIKFQPMLISRLNKVADLQAHRNFDCEGSRELMCFVHYNTAVQLFSREESACALHAFNKKFKQPLAPAELQGVKRAVDGVTNVHGECGHYILSAKTITRLLSLTESEITELNFFSSKKFVDRQAAKRKNAEKKKARNAKIVELYATQNLTQAEVAQKVGCSPRTVFAVLKENNAKLANITPSETQSESFATTNTTKEKAPLKTAEKQDFAKTPAKTTANKVAKKNFSHFAKKCPPCLGVVPKLFNFFVKPFSTPPLFPLLE